MVYILLASTYACTQNSLKNVNDFDAYKHIFFTSNYKDVHIINMLNINQG